MVEGGQREAGVAAEGGFYNVPVRTPCAVPDLRGVAEAWTVATGSGQSTHHMQPAPPRPNNSSMWNSPSSSVLSRRDQQPPVTPVLPQVEPGKKSVAKLLMERGRTLQ